MKVLWKAHLLAVLHDSMDTGPYKEANAGNDNVYECKEEDTCSAHGVRTV